MSPRTCVTPQGRFKYAIHEPQYRVTNLRVNDYIQSLGECENKSCDNLKNFPASSIHEKRADRIYEIPNAFDFKGTTFVNSRWADRMAQNPFAISLPEAKPTSLSQTAKEWFSDESSSEEKIGQIFASLPDALLLTLAKTSTDPADLVRLAHNCCEFVLNEKGIPQGLQYKKDDQGRPQAVINHHLLFEILANNRSLPNEYKEVMVLRPGTQGGSEIIGEWRAADGKSHIFEYLRRNSYIPWGHYAANMANDSVRYRISDLLNHDMSGLRHLYYQRTYTRMAEQLGLAVPAMRQMLEPADLEKLRVEIVTALEQGKGKKLSFNLTLWGWNFGFDCAPTGYRLHASHQQIHQQFAMLPRVVPVWINGKPSDESMISYGCGDLIRVFIAEYKKETGRLFFDDYITAIRSNRRMDGRTDQEESLIIYADENIMLFVPKAQTSQWEIQMMTLKPIGNIIEADQACRDSLDRGMLLAMRTLEGLGAKMVTTIEYSKRIDNKENGQRLLYAFLPRMPNSPGAFSEQQLRWIMGHYPEDFAAACRKRITNSNTEQL